MTQNNMKPNKFHYLKSTCVPLPIENVDTDQIIPARFLKAVTREGFGENLFRDWRYDSDDKPKKDFVLNDPRYKGEILVVGENFGSGSSREHAAWAIKDFGFKAVISSFFADIFKNNALNNGLLVVEIPEEYLKELFETIEKDPQTCVEINLENQDVFFASKKLRINFDIDPYKKMTIMKGFDDIDYLLSEQDKTKEFEKKRKDDYSLSF